MGKHDTFFDPNFPEKVTAEELKRNNPDLGKKSGRDLVTESPTQLLVDKEKITAALGTAELQDKVRADAGIPPKAGELKYRGPNERIMYDPSQEGEQGLQIRMMILKNRSYRSVDELLKDKDVIGLQKYLALYNAARPTRSKAIVLGENVVTTNIHMIDRKGIPFFKREVSRPVRLNLVRDQATGSLRLLSTDTAINKAFFDQDKTS